MDQHATETLVSTETEDGLLLHGLLWQPTGSIRKPALVWIHGFSANFYHPAHLRLGPALAAHGYAFVVGNTRGHDFGTWLEPRGGQPYLGGAAWERLEEAPRDVAAWIGLAARQGFPGVALIGHSIGTLKVTHYQAESQDPRVLGLALASPPLRPSWNTRAFPAAIAQAEQLVAEGRPETLFAGPWGPVSAQTYLSLDRFDFDQFGRQTATPNIGRVRCPLLVVLGTNEEHVVTPADLSIIRHHAVASERLECHPVEGADHFYTDHEPEVAAIVVRWADTLT